jgi:hypothetical protein
MPAVRVIQADGGEPSRGADTRRDHGCDRYDQIVRIDRLGEMRAGPGLQGPLSVRRSGVRRDRDGHQAPIVRAGFGQCSFEELITVFLRHLDIRHQHELACRANQGIASAGPVMTPLPSVRPASW